MKASPDSEIPADQTPSGLGSYLDEDVTFLLSRLSTAELEKLYTAPEDKEVLIQRGIAHYSEMLSREQQPDDRYLQIFEHALSRYGERMGRDIAWLAVNLGARMQGQITLLSLVRAGVPLGVLLVRALREMDRQANHYGISIIRDRGVDINALQYTLSRHAADSIVFVDGWTGKGAISDELEKFLQAHPELGIIARLVTLADPAGRAWLSASFEDWLIPSGILGSTVSGLISRSVLREGWQDSSEFHATAPLDELAEYDLSRRFVDTIHAHVIKALPSAIANHDNAERNSDADTKDFARQASTVIKKIADEFNIENINRIKPGIAEATRAVLRRLPERIIISSSTDEDLAALVHLATRSGVAIEQRGSDIAPYRAITIIAHRGRAQSAGKPA